MLGRCAWSAVLVVVLGLASCGDLPTLTDAVPDSPPLEQVGEEGCVSDGVCVLPPIEVIGEPCDPWLSLGWCLPPCEEVAPGRGGVVEAEGCGWGGGGEPVGGPGGGDGGAPPSATCPDWDPYCEPNTAPGDTCLTGDEGFDAPEVRDGLSDLWQRSNPDEVQRLRVEQAGWIVQRANGSWGFEPFQVSAQGPCFVNGNFSAPAAAVAWVHTHPYTSREEMVVCGAMKDFDSATGTWRDQRRPDGRPVYPVYGNRPSEADHELLYDVNFLRQQQGRRPLAGVILDVDRITVYTEDADEPLTWFTRCGY